jgi:hypothetical protein
MVAVALVASACGGGQSAPGAAGTAAPSGQAATVTLDGSSTVFLISEAVAEEFQKATPGRARHRRRLGHRRRLQEVLRRRDRHQQRLAPITKKEIELCAAAGISFIETADRLRRPRRRRQPESTRGSTTSRRAELKKDVGARIAGHGQAVERRCRRLARPASCTSSAPESTPAPTTTSPRPSSARTREPRRLHLERRRQRARAAASPTTNWRSASCHTPTSNENKANLKARAASTTARDNGAGPDPARASRP